MVTVFVGRALANGVIALAGAVKKLRVMVELATEKQPESVEDSPGWVKVDLYATGPELDAILDSPEFLKAYGRGKAMKATGAVHLCGECGSVRTSST